MGDRNYPREWVGLLPEEAARWVSQGIISDAQRNQILALYPEREGAARDRTVLILTLLGSILVGAGVILFFAANWPKIPQLVRVASIAAGVVAAYWSGYHLQFVRGDYPRLGHALLLLGAIFYGAGIWLIAQIFHLETHYPNGFLLWGIGILPVAWAVASHPMLYLASVVLTIWTVMEQGEFARFNFLYPILMLGAVLPLARRLQGALLEAGVSVGVFIWLATNLVSHMQHTGGAGVEMSMVGRAAVLYGAAVLLLGLARFGEERAQMPVGGILVLFGSYLMTFEWFSRWYEGSQVIPSVFGGPLFHQVAFGVLLALLAGAGYLYARRGDVNARVILPGILIPVVAALTVHVMPQVPRMVTFNLILFAGTIGVIALAILRRSELLLNLGLVVFIIHVLTRYFDLFFGAMDKSLFFVLGGILLLGGGWLLERNRRRWMRDWGGEEHVR